MSWQVIGKNRWRNKLNSEIVKYRMAGKFVYLAYFGGYKDCADYKTFSNLKLAKNYLDKDHQ